jgi:hypothetical protein
MEREGTKWCGSWVVWKRWEVDVHLIWVGWEETVWDIDVDGGLIIKIYIWDRNILHV